MHTWWNIKQVHQYAVATIITKFFVLPVLVVGVRGLDKSTINNHFFICAWFSNQKLVSRMEGCIQPVLIQVLIIWFIFFQLCWPIFNQRKVWIGVISTEPDNELGRLNFWPKYNSKTKHFNDNENLAWV